MMRKTITKLLSACALGILLMGGATACAEQPTEVEVPVDTQMSGSDDGNCVFIDGVIVCDG